MCKHKLSGDIKINCVPELSQFAGVVACTCDGRTITKTELDSEARDINEHKNAPRSLSLSSLFYTKNLLEKI
jgi:hypothetical protein